MDDLYFGTREFMTWIPCPSINMPRNKGGWTAESGFINGGFGVKRSLQGARRYEMDWPMRSGERQDLIHAFAEGAYGSGPFYFIDPQAATKNLAPAHLAHPWLATLDGPNLNGKNAPTPASADSTVGAYKYPVREAVYTFDGTETPLETWFPVPPGYTIHIGAVGSNTGANEIYARPDSPSTPFALTMMPEGSTRVNEALTHAACGGGVSIYIEGTGGTMNLRGVTVLVLKDGITPAGGDWVPGKGNSGCEFVGFPTDTLYSAEFDMQVTSAVLQEVGAWL